MSPKRIISLLPAATEILCALGLEEYLVGISHECDFPESVKKLPVCSSSPIHSSASSAEIDKQVKEHLSKAISLYEVDWDLIAGLKPDIILTQDQCEVCAVSLNDLEQSVHQKIQNPVEIISLKPEGLEDILQDILRIAQYIGVPERGEELKESLLERIHIIEHKLKFVKEKPNVVCVEWMEPLMTAGNWTPELFEIAGSTLLLSAKRKHSEWISWQQLSDANPDIILIAPCGFPIEKTMKEITTFLQNPLWAGLKAVQNGKVFIADGNHYFNRSGPRVVDTLEILAEIIHPGQFYFGFEGQAWVKM